jgi:hypothetical protein
VAQPGATDDVQLWAAWAPDSAHYARAYDPSNSIVVSTPEGVQVPLPTLTPYELVSRGQLVVGGWLDDRTLLVTYESLSSRHRGPSRSTRGPSVTAPGRRAEA